MRALVVEDEPTLRMHVVRLLERRGYVVDHASDAESALRLVSQRDYDLVITDLLLPRGSGLDVVEHACRSAVGPTVVVMTGFLSVDVGRKAFLAGATDFLEKPFTRERLLSTLPQA